VTNADGDWPRGTHEDNCGGRLVFDDGNRLAARGADQPGSWNRGHLRLGFAGLITLPKKVAPGTLKNHRGFKPRRFTVLFDEGQAGRADDEG
jgi:hypothetical protein